jgi:pantetheine-phosphate adenylyltransferase
MSQTSHIFYGGTFDPITNGHLHLIEKACSLFDVVTVVVAENPSKTPTFSLEQRLEMLKEAISKIPWRGSVIHVDVLPSHLYLADMAHQRGAKFLLRGIRDSIDFPYEQATCRTNKKINQKVETIYLMPDDNFSLISSSWVKGLVGRNGWRELLKDSVPSCVLEELKKHYLRKEIEKLLFNPLISSRFVNRDTYDIPASILFAYKDRKHHGYDHIIDLLELFDGNIHLLNLKDNDTELFYAKFAVIMHDVSPSEDESIKLARDCIGFNYFTFERVVTDCINATKHTENKPLKSELEKFIASIDLMVLASPPPKYSEYTGKVFNEYLESSGSDEHKFWPKWVEGRSIFLKNMLKREYIFPHATFDIRYGEQARQNMKHELSELKKSKRQGKS